MHIEWDDSTPLLPAPLGRSISIAEQDHLMAFNDDQRLKIAISAINGAVSQEHFSFNWKLLLTLAVWELGMRYCINGEYRELVMRKIRLGDHSPFVGLGSR